MVKVKLDPFPLQTPYLLISRVVLILVPVIQERSGRLGSQIPGACLGWSLAAPA